MEGAPGGSALNATVEKPASTAEAKVVSFLFITYSFNVG
jgi:hypothetical protein